MSETNNKAKEGLIEESEDKCERSEGGLQSDHQVLLDVQHDLRERIKELTCLYNITRLMAKPDISLDKVFNGVINIIKVAWQYPEITCARVLFGGKEFKTDNFRSTEWKQSSDIKLNGETAGALEVYYLEEKPEIDEGPFLKDERALIEDITKELGSFAERKQAEEGVKAAYTELNQIFNTATDGMCVIDKEFNILRINKAFSVLSGLSIDEAMGKKCYEVLCDSRCHTDDCSLVRILSGEDRVECEVKKERRDGVRIPCIVTATPYRKPDGELIGIVEDFKDITEYKKAEKRLRESKEYTEDLITSMKDGFSELDDRGVHLNVNMALCQMTGFTWGELIGVGPPHPYWPEEEYEEIQTAFQKTLRGEFEDFGLTFKRKNGERFPVIVSPSCLRDEERNVISYFATVKDITELKRVEQELRDYQNHLKELVEKRTAELVKTNEQLQEQIKKRIEFTRALVHELKTPLTPVLGASEAFVNQLQEGPYLNLAKNIFIGASQLNRRIDELLDLARSEIGKLKVSCKPLDPLGLIHEVVEEMSPDAEKKGQSLVLEVPSSLPLVSADEDRLQQIVINLLDNAFKFTPEGGMITLKAMEKDGNMIIEVQDTGPGIAKDEQQRLFQPYYRMESDRERLSGLGLGLALCKNLVELHQGEIWIKSKKGRGSTFGFSIPLSSDSNLKRDMKKEVSNEDSNNRG